MWILPEAARDQLSEPGGRGLRRSRLGRDDADEHHRDRDGEAAGPACDNTGAYRCLAERPAPLPRFRRLVASLLVAIAASALATPAFAQTSVPSDWSLKPTSLTTGAEFRLLFLSSTKRNGSASAIATYTHPETRASPALSSPPLICTDVDVRAPAERCPIGTRQKASSTRHAMPGLPSARHGLRLPFGRPGAALPATEPSRRPMGGSAVGRNRPDLHD